MEIEVSYSSNLDFRYGKLVVVQSRIEEGWYDSPQITELVVGSLLDIIV
jgi:hypothetical protein